MKAYFKSLTVMLFATFLLAGIVMESNAQVQPSQISAPAGTSMIPSDYVDTSIPDDPLYIFCSPDANGDSVLGTLSVSGGAPLCDFEWGKYDDDPGSTTYQQFIPFFTENSTPSSLVNNLESGFYQVIVTTNVGATNEAKHCRRAHVFVNETVVDFDPIAAGCQPFTLTGGIIDAVSDFTIYDPPPTPFEVDSATVIEVCFWADHTYVSDLGFYLIGPGGNRVDLLPPVSAWDQGAQVTTLDISVVTNCDPNDYYTNCNSGNHLQEFCFTSDPSYPAGDPNFTACICDMPTPLTGDFASCGPWDGVYGNMASQGGWAVQIYDCTPADVGYLQKVTLKFTGISECGLTTYEYNSGPINVTINDNSCDPNTAATYTVPLKTTSQHTITNEVTAEWSSFPVAWNTAAWGSQDFALNPTPNIDPEPLQSTSFCLTVFDHLYDTLGNEITQTNFPYYNQCQPEVCQYYETLPTDATINWYPQYICKNSPPVQLIPAYYGGVWTGNGQLWPNGPITSNGWFYPGQALLGDNTINYAFSGVCADDETVIINVVDAPVVSNIAEICNSTNTQFQVTFTVVGGNPGSYQFLNLSDSTNFPGSILGTTFTSGWINSPGTYDIIVTDNWDCDPVVVSGSHNCTCTSNAGDMPQALISLCETDQTNVQVLSDPQGNPTYVLDGNDGWEYFLHTEPFGVLGTVLGHNTTGIFQFQPGVMNYNQTYYISHVVGDNAGTPTNPLVSTTDACLSVSQGTPVMWFELPTAYAGLNDNICGKVIQLDADTADVGVGTWSCLTATGIIYSPNFNDPKTSVTVPYFDTNQFGCLLNTDYQFRWTIDNGPCQHFDDVTVTVKPIPDAFAGNDFTICGMQAQLTASWSSLCGPVGQSEGEWLGSGNITDPLAITTEVNVFNPGSYTYAWREFNGECEDEDYVTVTFLQQPTVDANHNDSVCGDTYELNAISTMGSGFWTGPLNTSFTNATLPQSEATIAFNGLSEVSANFIWTEQNGNCTATDTVTIVYSTVPNAAAGNNAETCGTSFTFDADILGYEYALGTWKTDFITAIFDDKNDPEATVTLPNTGSFPGQPQAGTFGDSSYVILPFTWVMDNNRCTDEDEVEITFYQMPEANAGPDTSVCGKVYNMKAKYSIGSSKGKWTMVSGPSSTSPTFISDTDPNTSVQVPLHGQYIFQWKEDNFHNQTCTSSDQVVIFFIEIPNVDGGPDRYICGNTFDLEATNSTGNGQWLPTQAYIADILDPHSFTQYGLTGTNDTVTYVWQEYNEYNGIQCVEKDTVEIVYMIVPDAQVNFLPGSSTDWVCGKVERPYDNILVGVAPGITGTNVQAYWSGNDANFFPNTFEKDPDSVVVGSYGVHEFVWVVENHHGDSVCPDTSLTIKIDFIQQPVADAGPAFDIACIDTINSPYYQLQGSWSVDLLPPTPGGHNPDSLTGVWITSAPTGIYFYHITATDTFLNDTLPNNWVTEVPIDYNNPNIYDLVWQETHYGDTINGGDRNVCFDWDTTRVQFAPRPTGRIEIDYTPHCIGYPARIKAKNDYNIKEWDWSDVDDGVILSSETGTPQDPGQGYLLVKWPEAEKLEEHEVRLITTNDWDCKSIADAEIIPEPDTVAVEISKDSEPAKCGEADGSIVLLPNNASQKNIYNWIDSLNVTYMDPSADQQIELATGDYYFSANSLSSVTPNTENVRCTDTFMIHVNDTGYIAALFQVPLADTSKISPHTVNFINLSYMTDSTYTSATNMHFVDLINFTPPFEELDAEYIWRFYHIRFDSLPDFDAPAEIFPWEDPIEIDGELFVEEIDPSVTFEEAGHYKIELIATSEFGCRDTVVVGYIFTDAKSDIVPGVNVFTPNGDGTNDLLEFDTETLKSMHGQIFSRWGKLIYEWTWNVEDQTPNPGWWDGKLDNGQDAAPGVYFYVIEGVGLDDTEFSGKEYAKAFHLIREKQ